MDRHLPPSTFLRHAAALLLATPLAGVLARCGGGGGRMMDGRPPEWMMSRGMDRQMMCDMPVIRDLLVGHDRIARSVEHVPDGIRAVTRSADPELAAAIRTHVRAMKERVEEGNGIRLMDPVFREIFEHHAPSRCASTRCAAAST